MSRTFIHLHLALLAAILVLAADSSNLPLLAADCLLWGWTAYHRRSDWAGSNLFLLTWLVFPLLKDINHYLLPWHADVLLATIDRHLWGGRILPAYFRYEAPPYLTDLLAVCYFSFYAIVLGSVAWYAYTRATPAARRYFNGLIFLYSAGLIGYFLLPAAGPAFTTHPDGGAGGIIGAAAQRHHQGRRYRHGRFPQPAHRPHPLHHHLPVARRQTHGGAHLRSAHRRYHYGVDVLAGFLLAILTLCAVRIHID